MEKEVKMKKVFLTMAIMLLAISFALAQEESKVGIKDPESKGTMQTLETQTPYNGNQLDSVVNGEKQKRIQGGEQIVFQDGKTVMFMREGEKLRIQSGEHIAECREECNLSKEQKRIHITMSNGIKSEIKIMPDVASERALERLRLKLCENCTLELKEVGEGNETKMVYELKTKARARILGIFKTNVDVEAQVDAETGEITKAKKPWWARLTQ
jgi:hypothetical protein